MSATTRCPKWCESHVDDVTCPDAGLISGYHQSRPMQADGVTVHLVGGDSECPVVEIAEQAGRTVIVPVPEVSALVCALLSVKSLTEVN